MRVRLTVLIISVCFILPMLAGTAGSSEEKRMLPSQEVRIDNMK